MKPDLVPGLLSRATDMLEAEFAGLPAYISEIECGEDAAQAILNEAAHRLGGDYPYFHPLYAGQMLKPPHPVARAAYALAMKMNPNNHARDGGRASSEMEIEAVSGIAAMFGWMDGGFLGHLTSSGTIANLEALWVAGETRPGTRIVASEQAHYTHSRICSVLKQTFHPVACDDRGRMSLDALEAELRRGDVGAVVATLGTTATGAVDPLAEILALRARYGFRVHVDAAYGGYFGLIANDLESPARQAFQAIGRADSIAIDPHKHGLQPYGCGCVLFQDPAVGRHYKHDSPYTYFTSSELHLGEISLECSRAGAAAVALWATQRILPLEPGGAFAKSLARSRRAALDLHRRLAGEDQFETPSAGGPELDIVVWKMRSRSAETASDLAQKTFLACGRRDLHLALVQLPLRWFHFEPEKQQPFSEGPGDAGLVRCLRSVLMKPEHEAWVEEIWGRLKSGCDEAIEALAKIEDSVDGASDCGSGRR